jgi:copper chaperone CopZ
MATLSVIKLQIVHLRCRCCADIVLDAVRAIPGVGQTELDYPSARLTVELEAQHASEEAIRAAIKLAG